MVYCSIGLCVKEGWKVIGILLWDVVYEICGILFCFCDCVDLYVCWGVRWF